MKIDSLKKLVVAFIFILNSLVLNSCDDNPSDNNCDINPSIVELDIPAFNYFIAVMNENEIYTVAPPKHFIINNSYEIIESNELPIPWGNWTYIEINDNGTKLLLVKSLYYDVSGGGLFTNMTYKANN